MDDYGTLGGLSDWGQDTEGWAEGTATGLTEKYMGGLSGSMAGVGTDRTGTVRDNTEQTSMGVTGLEGNQWRTCGYWDGHWFWGSPMASMSPETLLGYGKAVSVARHPQMLKKLWRSRFRGEDGVWRHCRGKDRTSGSPFWARLGLLGASCSLLRVRDLEVRDKWQPPLGRDLEAWDSQRPSFCRIWRHGQGWWPLMGQV